MLLLSLISFSQILQTILHMFLDGTLTPRPIAP